MNTETLSMLIVSLIFAAGMGGWLLWIFARHSEKRTQQVHIQTLEAKLHLAQNRTKQLTESLSRVQNEHLSLRTELEKERTEKIHILKEYTQPFKRIRMTSALTLGLIFAVLGGLFAAIWTENQKERTVTQLEVNRAVAESRARQMQEDLIQLEGLVNFLRRELQSEVEARIVAETKLHILAGSERSSGWRDYLFFDFKRNKARQNSESGEEPRTITVTPQMLQTA